MAEHNEKVQTNRRWKWTMARLLREEEGWPWVLVGEEGKLRGGSGSQGSKAKAGLVGMARCWLGFHPLLSPPYP